MIFSGKVKESTRHVVWILVLASLTMIFSFFYLRNEVLETLGVSKPSVEYWKMFSEITLEKRYIEEADGHYRIPVFTPELQALSGSEITLVGYYLPYSRIDSVIILSRFPNASCFFCGMAGIESVAMVELDQETKFRTDQRLVAHGKLRLNDSNLKKLAFVIEHASVEEL